MSIAGPTCDLEDVDHDFMKHQACVKYIKIVIKEEYDLEFDTGSIRDLLVKLYDKGWEDGLRRILR